MPQPVAPVYPVSTRQRVLCALTFLLLVLTGFFGSLFMMAPFLPLAYVLPSVFLLFMNSGVRLWLMLSEILLNGVLRIKVRHFGDEFILPSFFTAEADEETEASSSILLLNHRTRVDWLFAFCLGRYARNLTITLKRELSTLPGVGWAMQLDGFIFLRRRIALDLARIYQAVEYLLHLQGIAQILLFPEGTNLGVYGLKKSDVFAEKRGLMRYRYTLHPRTTGFECLVRALGSNLAYVYDVTVAYPYALIESELRMALGYCPQEVHFHVRRWPVSQLPKPIDTPGMANNATPDNLESATSPLGRWLQERWAEKEQLLKEYYARPPEERRFAGPEVDREGAIISNHEGDQWSLAAYIVLAYWIIFLGFSVTLLWSSWIIRYYVVGMTIFLAYRGYGFPGLAEWVADLAGFPLKPIETPFNAD